MMKSHFFVPFVLAMVLVVAPAFAQSETKEEKPAAETAAVTPKAQVDEFFRQLVEGRVDAAYDQLLKGTKIAEMPKDVLTLKAKTREAIKVFGQINDYEPVDVKEVGLHLKRFTTLSLGKQFPIRWRFYFYETGNVWKLIDIRIDDRLADLFGEPAPAATGSSK